MFQVRFRLQSVPPAALAFEGLESSLVEIDYGLVKAELGLELSDRTDGLEGFIEYNTDLFSSQTIERLWLGYLEALDRLANAPHTRLTELNAMNTRDPDVLNKRPENGPTPGPAAVHRTIVGGPQGARRQSIKLVGAELVKNTVLDPARDWPLLVEPIASLDLVEWGRSHVRWIEERLARHGRRLAPRIRRVSQPGQFEAFLSAIAGELADVHKPFHSAAQCHVTHLHLDGFTRLPRRSRNTTRCRIPNEWPGSSLGSVA